MRSAAKKSDRKQSRREEGKPVNRDQIIAVTARLFREHGYHATSMQDIADEVGILKGSLYHHISQKEELLLAILEDYVKEVHQAVREVAQSDLGPKEKLRQIIKAEIDVMARHQNAIVVWSSERGRQKDLFGKLESRTRQVDQILRDVIRAGVESGIWKASNESIASQAIIGMIAYFSAWFRPQGTLNADEIGSMFSAYADRILSK